MTMMCPNKGTSKAGICLNVSFVIIFGFYSIFKLSETLIGDIATGSTIALEPTIDQVELHTKNTTQTKIEEKPKLVLPNVLLVGAQKAGSTTLASWMVSEGVCTAKVLQGEPSYYSKEVHFFNNEERRKRGVKFYNLHYQHCYNANKMFVMDATPNYLWHPDQVHSVYKDDPNLKDLKIIISLREPIARELSIFNHMRVQYVEKQNQETWLLRVVKKVGDHEQLKTFQEFTETVLLPDYINFQKAYSPHQPSFSQAHYAMYLKRWFQLFEPKQILVLSYEEDVKPGIPAKERIQRFLNLPIQDAETAFDELNEHQSQYKVARVPCSAVDMLSPYVDKWNKELMQLLQSHERPSMERKPFPCFDLPTDCAVEESDVRVDILE